VILVDDFIGSGETIIGCLNYLDTLGIEIDHIIIMTLVIQNTGFQKLQDIGVRTLYSEFRERGINDSYSEPIKGKLIAAMNAIENFLKIDQKNRFGYNQTEALVKMIRVPNNTFPVFWEKRRLQNGDSFCGPFPRN
jgi:hypothetical protein